MQTKLNYLHEMTDSASTWTTDRYTTVLCFEEKEKRTNERKNVTNYKVNLVFFVKIE